MHSCQCLVHSAVADYHIRKPLYSKILQMLGFYLALIWSNLNKWLPHNNCFKTSVSNIETVLSVTVLTTLLSAGNDIVRPGGGGGSRGGLQERTSSLWEPSGCSEGWRLTVWVLIREGEISEKFWRAVR